MNSHSARRPSGEPDGGPTTRAKERGERWIGRTGCRWCSGRRRDGPRDRGRAGAPGSARAGGGTGRVAGLPAGVEQVRADLYDPADAARAVAGASVVYHAAQPPYAEWDGNFERLNASDRRRDRRGRRPPRVRGQPLHVRPRRLADDRGPRRSARRTARARQRIRLAADLLARHERGELEVAIGRSSRLLRAARREHGAGGAGVRGGRRGQGGRRASGRTDQASLVQLPARPRPRDGDPGRPRRGGRTRLAPAGHGSDRRCGRSSSARSPWPGRPPGSSVDGPIDAQGRRACSCRWRARSASSCTSGRSPSSATGRRSRPRSARSTRTPLDEAHRDDARLVARRAGAGLPRGSPRRRPSP